MSYDSYYKIATINDIATKYDHTIRRSYDSYYEIATINDIATITQYELRLLLQFIARIRIASTISVNNESTRQLLHFNTDHI